MKRITIFLFLLIICALIALPQANKVKVTAKRAIIYAQPSLDSYQIGWVKKGTILNLFQEKLVRNKWYYIYLFSVFHNSKISGFVQASQVEIVYEEKQIIKKEKKPIMAKKILYLTPLPIKKEFFIIHGNDYFSEEFTFLIKLSFLKKLK